MPADRQDVPAESDAQLLARAADQARRLADQLRSDAVALLEGGPGEACGRPVAEAADAAAAVARALSTVNADVNAEPRS